MSTQLNDFKAKLQEGFIEKAETLVSDLGLLHEFAWHPLGIQGRSKPALSIKAYVKEDGFTSEDGANLLSKMRESVKSLLPGGCSLVSDTVQEDKNAESWEIKLVVLEDEDDEILDAADMISDRGTEFDADGAGLGDYPHMCDRRMEDFGWSVMYTGPSNKKFTQWEMKFSPGTKLRKEMSDPVEIVARAAKDLAHLMHFFFKGPVHCQIVADAESEREAPHFMAIISKKGKTVNEDEDDDILDAADMMPAAPTIQGLLAAMEEEGFERCTYYKEVDHIVFCGDPTDNKGREDAWLSYMTKAAIKNAGLGEHIASGDVFFNYNNPKDYVWIYVPRGLLSAASNESREPSTASRIIESQGTVRTVTDRDGATRIDGEWKPGDTAKSLAEHLKVDEESLQYDPATGSFTIYQGLQEGNDQIEWKRIESADIPALKSALVEVFSGQADWVVPYTIQHMDPSISVVALKEGQAVGFYILGHRQLLEGVQDDEMTPTEDLSGYASKKGVEGVALGIIPSFRGHGLGSRFKDYPKTLGVDYIWGMQLRGLKNLDHWLKRRRMVAENEDTVITVEDYRRSV